MEESRAIETGRTGGAEESIVYHITVMDGFRQEAESRMRQLLKDGKAIQSDPNACRKVVAGLQELFDWYSGHIGYHREAILRAIPDTEEKRRSIARGEEQIRSLRRVHWASRGTSPEAGDAPKFQRGTAWKER